jgi:hypothetical protein
VSERGVYATTTIGKTLFGTGVSTNFEVGKTQAYRKGKEQGENTRINQIRDRE